MEEAKKLYSIILSAPIPEQSECCHSVPQPPLVMGTLPGDIPMVAHTRDPTETKDDLEQLTAEIKKMANSVRNKLKSEWPCLHCRVISVPAPWDSGLMGAGSGKGS